MLNKLKHALNIIIFILICIFVLLFFFYLIVVLFNFSKALTLYYNYTETIYYSQPALVDLRFFNLRKYPILHFLLFPFLYFEILAYNEDRILRIGYWFVVLYGYIPVILGIILFVLFLICLVWYIFEKYK